MNEHTLAITPGRYIVAVSGGVDSMVLLDMVRRRDDLQIVAAHVDHGIRLDSAADRHFVERYTMSHNITLETKVLTLGAKSSEATARKARYNFLQKCRIKYKANAILVAHHQDDVIETAIIAILRGTGWRGMAPFVNASTIIRPLLDIPKYALIAYARSHHVPWREDASNQNESYLRNFVRHTIVPRLNQRSDTWHEQFLRYIRKGQQLRRTIEKELDSLLDLWQSQDVNGSSLPRHALIMLPTPIGYEVLQRFVQLWCGNTLERPLAEAALLFAKVAKPGKMMPLGTDWQLRVTRSRLIVEKAGAMVS